MSFVLCPRCSRHVNVSAAACPFCAANLANAKAAGHHHLRHARTRARLLFGTASGAIAATAIACGEHASIPFYGSACTGEACEGRGDTGSFVGFSNDSAVDASSSEDGEDADAGEDADTDADASDDAVDGEM